MLKIKDLKTLMKLKTNNKDGDLALVEETKTLYKWDGANWCIHKPEGGINVSLYELNQSAMTAMPPMSDEHIKLNKELIREHMFLQLAPEDNTKYFMLLNNEQKYYTTFIVKPNITTISIPSVEDEVIECLQSRGKIKDISFLEDGIEFWVTEGDNSYVYYLFNYRGGVIECQ